MYSGFITTLKNVRKHPGADRLLLAECFGNTVVLGLDAYEGQKVVYFPVDGQLDEEFAKANNLVRIKNEDGTYSGGYLDEKRLNIKAVKLRGEKSDGLAMPIECLSPYCDINELTDGTMITTLNGHPICRKYIPKRNGPRTHTSGPKVKKKKEVEFPFFEEHVDTEQLAYNKNKFHVGDTCYITLKMHGCFTGSDRLVLWNAPHSICMRDVREGDYVVGYKDGRFIPSKVIKTYRNGNTKNWVRLKVSHYGMSGENYSKIQCTPDHLFWDFEHAVWVAAKDLQPGQPIHTVCPSILMTSLQKEFLIGKVLGDGSLRRFKKGAEIQFSHKKEHEAYLDYCIKALKGIGCRKAQEHVSGYGTTMVRGSTVRTPELLHFANEYFSSESGKLNERIVNDCSILSLAIFYMDDGNLMHSDQQRDRALFATCDYNEDDIGVIQKCFAKFGIETKAYEDNRGYYRLRLNTEEAYKFFELIKPFVPLVMQYKLPVEMRTGKEVSLDLGEAVMGYFNIPQCVVATESYTSRRPVEKYDIETETHNYVVGGCLVHNSSGRSAHAYFTKEKPLGFFGKLFHRKPKTITGYDYVSGTRRVVLENYEGGFYGDNKFREKYHEMFKGKLYEGEEVFYEIVGYTDDGNFIMGQGDNKKVDRAMGDKTFTKKYGPTTSFTYGCEPGQNDIYVYRMTITTPQGVTIEYPWDLVKQRCDQMGVKHVIEFDKFLYKDEDDLMQRVEAYYDGEDPVGQSHIREGVVIRLDNRSKFEAYKHKNFAFKVIEGIIKDTAAAPDMEEAQEVPDEG